MKKKRKDFNPIRIDSRICYGINWFATEKEANEYDAYVRENGITYNGGWFHGMACGRDTSFDVYENKIAKYDDKKRHCGYNPKEEWGKVIEFAVTN